MEAKTLDVQKKSAINSAARGETKREGVVPVESVERRIDYGRKILRGEGSTPIRVTRHCRTTGCWVYRTFFSNSHSLSLSLSDFVSPFLSIHGSLLYSRHLGYLLFKLGFRLWNATHYSPPHTHVSYTRSLYLHTH